MEKTIQNHANGHFSQYVAIVRILLKEDTLVNE